MATSRIILSLLSLLLAAPALAQSVCGINFRPGALVSTQTNPRAVIVADFNGDGFNDVVTTSVTSNQLIFAPGTGLGTFGPQVITPLSISGPAALLAADFNGDGLLDLAVCGPGSILVSILFGNGAGGFTLSQNITVAAGPVSLCSADFNNDGFRDLVCANSVSNSLSMIRGTASGVFNPATSIALERSNPSAVVAVDFSLDNIPDVVVSFQPSGSVTLMLSAGGSLISQNTLSTGGNQPVAMVAADVNHDNRLDLAIAHLGGSLTAMLASGTTFNPAFTIGNGATMRGVAAGDLNNDGNIDLIGASAGDNTIQCFIGNGAGGFAAGTPFTSPSPYGVAIARLDGDAYPDIVAASSGGNSTNAYLFDAFVTLPVIQTQPIRTHVITGQSTGFSVGVTGQNLSYQWRRNGSNIVNAAPFSGATSANLTINPAALSQDLDIFDVVVTNPCGSVTSSAVALGVLDCPADFNGDGEVDFFDYLDFVDAYSIGC